MLCLSVACLRRHADYIAIILPMPYALDVAMAHASLPRAKMLTALLMPPMRYAIAAMLPLMMLLRAAIFFFATLAAASAAAVDAAMPPQPIRYAIFATPAMLRFHTIHTLSRRFALMFTPLLLPLPILIFAIAADTFYASAFAADAGVFR